MPFFKYSTRRLKRRSSQLGYKSSTGSLKTLSGELESIIESSDVNARKRMKIEIDSFAKLHARYVAGKKSPPSLDWDKVSAPDLVDSSTLPQPNGNFDCLNKLAVLKFNGGLGTSMGMVGAKSALVVKNGQTFLDIAVEQIKHLNKTFGVDVPLLLMTSSHTEQDTMRVITKYANQNIRITSFNQSRYPRLYSDTSLPLPQHTKDDNRHWYPPGHGDLYASLQHSGLLDKLLRDGKEYLFVSNSDNLGATVDVRILQYMRDSQSGFIMEVTKKTKADIKGGTLVNCEGSLQLLEFSQVEQEHADDFQSVKKFGVFNTNNLWINLPALKRLIERGDMELDVIATLKPHPSGRSMLELETSAGSAVKFFESAQGISVPRSRYLPVKNCSDLLLMQSDIYDFMDGKVKANLGRMFDTTPVIKLGDRFKNILEFQDRFKHIPHISDLDHLTVAGDVFFGRDVTLRGTVIIIAKDGQRIDIPDGCVLENRLVSGNLISIEL